MGSFAPQGTVGSYMAISPKESSQADFRIPAIAVGTQINLLILDRSPKPFHQDVVVAPPSARPADLDVLFLQPAHEVGRGELTTLVGMKDLWSAATRQGHLQRVHAELRIQAVGKLPAENVSGEEVNDRDQVQEPFAQRDIGDIRCPNLINGCDLVEVHQTGKPLRRTAWDGRPWFLVDRP